MKKIDLAALKARVDLVAVIRARGVLLEAKGSNFVGLCPFKPEKTPSFTVDPRRRIWKCFGCNKGGDAFKFIKLKDGLSLPEAIEKVQPFAAEPAVAESSNAATAPESVSSKGAPSPSGVVRERIVSHWQKELAHIVEAQTYLKARLLWRPELLRAFRVGYASGSLATKLPGGGTIREQLTGFGILNTAGNEFFYGRIVVPVFADGLLVNVYGRAIGKKSKVPHLYLKGTRRGVFNRPGIHSAREVILTEAPLDALSLIALGFGNVTTSYGAHGFTPDLAATFRAAKITRVYCAYDGDAAGDLGARSLAEELAGQGIEVRRVALPCKDANEFLVGGGTHEAFQALLDAARPVAVAAPAPATVMEPPAPSLPEGSSNEAPDAAPSATTPADSGAWQVERAGRVYEVVVFPRRNVNALRVRVKINTQGRPFIDTLNLYQDAARQKTAQRLKQLFGSAVSLADLEADLVAVTEAVETRERTAPAAPPSPAETMSAEDKAAALAFLMNPNLVAVIREHLALLGVVGEERAKLLVYFVATSRRRKHPLALVVVSRSSAGKSFIVSRVMEMMPEEEVCAYARVSAKALFHDETERLKHKLLVIEEAHGMHDAAYALRVLLSNSMISSLSTITDPTTGRHKAQENVVYGPVALLVTTTEELDFETLTRAFVISVDESEEQTRRIHQMQRQAWTLEGLNQEGDRERILATHRNAQRLLKPLAVVNPYVENLTFPTGTLRLRREHAKYLALIGTITHLFQYQRVQGAHPASGAPYVETTPVDIDLANELVVDSLRQAFAEVTEPARELLRAIRALVVERAGNDPLPEVSFTRRDLRERTKWADHPIRDHLKKLEELEYVRSTSGRFGKEYVYTLSPDHVLAVDGTASIADEIRDLGLTGSNDLARMPNGGRAG